MDVGQEPDFPPLLDGETVHMRLIEAGPVMSGAAGAISLTWVEIAAYQAATGQVLGIWEAGAIRSMSGAYAGALHDAREPNAAAPYEPSPEKRQQMITAQLKAAFRGRC